MKNGSLAQDRANIAGLLFRGPEKYNCAQAILRTFQSRFPVQEKDIAAAGSMGGGKAKDEVCGALYAGILLLGDQSKTEQLTRDFERAAGSVECKKIMKLERISCKECVMLTARLLDSL